MDMNSKLAVAIISVLITLSLTLGSFAYKTGEYNNEVKNIKEQQLIIKKDLTEQINHIEERKADKDIVDLIFQKINSMDEKLDKLILKEHGEK